MVDGTYDVTVRIPFGTMRGTVMLASDGSACTATVQVDEKSQQADGTVEGDSFAFGGEAETPLGRLHYDIEGTADGETLSAVAKTKVGNLRISGRRA